jgi:hypothetical protein
MCSFSDSKLFIIEMCPTEENSGMLMSSVCIEVGPTEENSGMLMLSVCIVVLVLTGRGGKRDGR